MSSRNIKLGTKDIDHIRVIWTCKDIMANKKKDHIWTVFSFLCPRGEKASLGSCNKIYSSTHPFFNLMEKLYKTK